MVKDLIKFVGLCLALENENTVLSNKREEIERINEMMNKIANDKKAA